MPRVLNRYVDLWDDHPSAISIERVSFTNPGPWGNKFVVGVHGARGDCVAFHRTWVWDDEQREYRERVRQELRDRDLMCVCAPMPCHGDVLLEIANGEELE